MISTVYAMGTGGTGEGAQGMGIMGFLPYILVFAVFYMLLIRPQQQKAKQHQKMIAELKKGQAIITTGGIHGVIQKLDETTIKLEVADKTVIKVSRGNVAGVVGKES